MTLRLVLCMWWAPNNDLQIQAQVWGLEEPMNIGVMYSAAPSFSLRWRPL